MARKSRQKLGNVIFGNFFLATENYSIVCGRQTAAENRIPPVSFGGFAFAAENYLFLTAAVENKAYFRRLLAAESYPVSCSGA